MNEPWTLDERVACPAESLDGYEVWATDGNVGTIERHSCTSGTSRIVVDTAAWTFGTKRIIGAEVIDRVDDAARRVHVRLCKAQIKSAPELEQDCSCGDDGRSPACDYFGRYLQ